MGMNIFNLFEDFLVESTNADMNLIESDSEYVLELNVPGYTKDDLKIQIENGNLKITSKVDSASKNKNNYLMHGFTKKPKINKEITLGNGFSRKGIKAKVENGILIIKIPKYSSSQNIEIL